MNKSTQRSKFVLFFLYNNQLPLTFFYAKIDTSIINNYQNMQITWNGHSCFNITTKTNQGEITIVTDPFDSKELGIKLPKITADIVTVSHDHYDHNNAKEIQGNPFIISSPGEYEIKGVFVNGFPSFHDKNNGDKRGKNNIYTIKLIEEGISLAHLGDLGQILNNEELGHLEKIDILFVPVGGKYTLDAKEAIEVINQIEPRIVIPMHYKIPGLKITDIDGVDIFCRELGLDGEKMNKLKISKKDLPQEETRVVILEI